MPEVTEEAIALAIERWYSANYSNGVRLRGIDRELLARFIAQRLGVRPPESVLPSDAQSVYPSDERAAPKDRAAGGDVLQHGPGGDGQ